jgi:hypothetical protein
VVGAPLRGGRPRASPRVSTAARGDDAATTEINPAWLDGERYVAFLNDVFPGQWSRAAYEWYAARTFNHRASDILVRARGQRILSGMALCYRQVRAGGEAPLEVCVISAAGTLPGEQRHGHYAELLLAALERCRDRACTAVLGFVTSQNGSGRGLIRLGARPVPSFYIASAGRPRVQSGPPRLQRKAQVRALLPALEQQRQWDEGRRQADAVGHFHYEHREDWSKQFLERPHAVQILRLSHDSMALIEAVGATDRLQWLSCPRERTARHIGDLARASARRGRNFFMYSLSPYEADAASRAGLRIRDGYLMILSTGRSGRDAERLGRAAWEVDSGDRV